MPYADPEKESEKKRRWRRRNRDRQRDMTRDWARRNPDRIREYARRQALRRKAESPKRVRRAPLPKEELLKRAREARTRDRLAAIVRLGGRCQTCGFADQRALEFDHITPLKRRTNQLPRRPGDSSAREILKARCPEAVYQLLCANCHTIKTREGNEYGGAHTEQRGLDTQVDLFSK